MADFPGIPSRDTVVVYVKTHPFDGAWACTYDNGYFSQQSFYAAPMGLSIAGTAGTVSLALNDDRFSGAFPADMPDPESPYGRYAVAEIRNHGTLFVVNVYEYHYADPQRLPDRMRLMLASSGLGTQLSGNIYKCYGDSYMCSWSDPVMGSVTLNRVY